VTTAPDGAGASAVRAVLAFDGSPGAHRALEHAARVLPGASAIVVVAWEGFAHAAVRHGVVGPVAGTAVANADAAARRRAQDLAEEGARRAAALGLRARAEPVETQDGVWRAVERVAHRCNADVVVVGARGRGDVAAAMLGSVSHDLVRHAARPVLVVPPPGRRTPDDVR
jgi:nucleotide-binding universal stress UspA family protein